jgi:hypothetical protein
MNTYDMIRSSVFISFFQGPPLHGSEKLCILSGVPGALQWFHWIGLEEPHPRFPVQGHNILSIVGDALLYMCVCVCVPSSTVKYSIHKQILQPAFAYFLGEFSPLGNRNEIQ